MGLMKRNCNVKRAVSIACLLSMMAVASTAFALDVAGVKINETAHVGNRDLQLNGAGIRYKVIFKVYTAALYLPEKKTTTTDVINEAGPRRISLVMLRDIDSEDFSRAFLEGIRKNTDRADAAKMIDQLTKFGELFATIPELKKGDNIVADWDPAVGTTMQVNGKKVGGVLTGITFYNALLKIWLGDKPADSKLKVSLLGGAA
ncbi:chalcone isomerase family protein [Glaciimonas soli]|nr:chalcone isomerase family protein [Glaciimonas soli]